MEMWPHKTNHRNIQLSSTLSEIRSKPFIGGICAVFLFFGTLLWPMTHPPGRRPLTPAALAELQRAAIYPCSVLHHTPRPKKGAKISSSFLLNLARAPHYKGGVPPARHASLHVVQRLRDVLGRHDVRRTGARPSGGGFMQGNCRRCACIPYGPCLAHGVDGC